MSRIYVGFIHRVRISFVMVNSELAEEFGNVEIKKLLCTITEFNAEHIVVFTIF